LPGAAATLAVSATGATDYQWRFNGINLSGATNATLPIASVQATNCGYYVALAGNAAGWQPSQMAYLSLDYTYGGISPNGGGLVPFSNQTNSYFQGDIESCADGTEVNGSAYVMAGPQLDQMQPCGQLARVANGYYGSASQTRTVRTVAPGQSVYYRVDVYYTNSGTAYYQPSTVMSLTAGGGSFPVPSSYGLKFPGWWACEELEPTLEFATPTNLVLVAGETFSFTNQYWADTDYGIPTGYWRKDGNTIPGNFTTVGLMGASGYFLGVLTITNVQAADAGIYDLVVLGNEWIIGPKITVSIQTTNGFGLLKSPRWDGTNFACDLLGAASRSYVIQCSSNLVSWSNLATLSNINGTITFSNSPATDGAQFYRAWLQPAGGFVYFPY
jgi:hypothetical protein